MLIKRNVTGRIGQCHTRMWFVSDVFACELFIVATQMREAALFFNEMYAALAPNQRPEIAFPVTRCGYPSANHESYRRSNWTWSV